MNTLAIDIGSYSIKFYEAKKERSKVNPISMHEIILGKVQGQFPEGTPLQTIQTSIIKSYLETRNFDGKIISQLPSHFITSRYLSLPILQKKKVEQMLAFQLDDILPFPMNQVHYVAQLSKKSKHTQALVNIVRCSDFDSFQNDLTSKDIKPHHLTSELFVINSYANALPSKAPTLILDMGHKGTRGYILSDKEVLNNHYSSFGGKLLDKLISETYQITIDDAITYKHENCFVLTDTQLDVVDSEQRNFALLIKTALMPLIQDIKRWDIGFKALYGISIEKIYITGGSSLIRNLEALLQSHLGIPVNSLPIYDYNHNYHHPFEGTKKESYTLSHLMVTALHSKNQLTNFYQGHYSQGLTTVLPLHSTVFIFSRVLTLSLIMLFALTLERLFYIQKISILDKSMVKLLKSPQVQLTRNEQVLYKRIPERILKNIQKKEKTLEQEIAIIQASSNINAITPLATLSSLLSTNFGVYLEKFESDGATITATFASEDSKELEAVIRQLESGPLPKLKITRETDSPNKIFVQFKGNNI